MIKGVGTDIIEVSRIERLFHEHGETFLDKLFTQNEKKYFSKYKDPGRTIAGRYAAKEAISKALGTGFGDSLAWQDLEVLNDEQGKPVVQLKNRSETIHLSISHCHAYATAVAIWEEG